MYSIILAFPLAAFLPVRARKSDFELRVQNLLSQKDTGKREGIPGNLPGNFVCIFLLKKVTGNREAIS